MTCSGLAGELLAQRRILRGDAHRASVQVALAHHDASQRDQRRGGESELFGAQQRGDGHVAAGLELAVGLHGDAAAQVVEHQYLLRFGQPQLPGSAGVLQRSQRRRARAAVVAGDQNHVGMGFRHTRGHRADARFGDQLDRNPGLGIDVLQVVDQLRQIFDRVDVVMRRRRNQSHAGNRVAHLRDDLVHFVAGKLAALAGLRALRDLDLQIVGVDQVVGGDAEAARRHLFDGTAAPVAVGIALEALFVLAAFAGVGAAADPVHGDRQRLVRFLADRSERHRAGGEALDDFTGRLDFVELDRTLRLAQHHQAAQRAQILILLVDERGVFLEGGIAFVAALVHRVLQLRNRQRIQQVIFAVDAKLIGAADVQLGFRFRGGAERVRVLGLGFARQNIQAHAFDARSGSREVPVDQVLVQADGFEDLRAAIALQRRDAHLREDLEQPLVDGLLVVLERRGEVHRQQPFLRHVLQRFDGQVGIDRARAIAR